MTALGKYGKPADVAGLAVYLASADAAYVTGTVMSVDGGFGA
jgi:NAD(P)-dependent dehydrogenase (short-subunit alcohol dehydrogenase family)